MIKKLLHLYHRLVNFFIKGLWEQTAGASGRLLKGVAGRAILTGKIFLRERMQHRASALTYSTLLSVVPLLAIIFAIAKGFGLSAIIEQMMRENISASPEFVDTLVDFVNSYLNHTRGGAFIGFGMLLLLWTLLKLTGAIESALNDIWQVKRSRPMFRKVTDYGAVFFLLPVFILVSGGLSIYAYSFVGSLLPAETVLRPTALWMIKVIPFGFTCLFFTGLFAFLPNTRVTLRSALIAGIPTGIAFQFLQFFYIHSQIWLSGYDAVYGSFAALPLFMLMCQISWYVILLGASLSYVDQNYRTFYYGKDFVKTSREFHDYLCISLTRDICERFAEGEKPLTAEALAERRKEPFRLVNDILFELCQIGVLMEVSLDEKGEKAAYMPACDIKRIDTAFILRAIDSQGDKVAPERADREWTAFREKRKKAQAQM